jgi:hypothetical protein
MSNDNPYASDIMQSKKLIRKEEVEKVIDKWICISEDAKPTAQEVAYGIKKDLKL